MVLSFLLSACASFSPISLKLPNLPSESIVTGETVTPMLLYFASGFLNNTSAPGLLATAQLDGYPNSNIFFESTYRVNPRFPSSPASALASPASSLANPAAAFALAPTASARSTSRRPRRPSSASFAPTTIARASPPRAFRPRVVVVVVVVRASSSPSPSPSHRAARVVLARRARPRAVVAARAVLAVVAARAVAVVVVIRASRRRLSSLSRVRFDSRSTMRADADDDDDDARGGFINPEPIVYARARDRASARDARAAREGDETTRDAVDALEIFDHVRDINDPEHPYSLERLNVVSASAIECDDARNRVRVEFTPTVPHCSMATLIGLSIRVKLLRTLPRRFKVDVVIAPGTHASERAVNKQLNDKERVAAALENGNLLEKVDLCLSGKTAV